MLSYSLYIHPTERRLRPFSLFYVAQTSDLTPADRINCAVRKDATWQPTPYPLPRYGICYKQFLLTYKISISYRYRDILAISYRYRIEFQKPI